MRVFLAVFPPPEAVALAFDAAQRVRESAGSAAGRVSWIRRDNLHYTLKFLGEIGEDGARRAAEGAREAAASLPAFDVTLGAPGAFPNGRRARVLWLGLERGEPEFKALGRAVDVALAKRGFDREKRAFSPHLTIGRVRDDGFDWTEALAATPPLGLSPAARFRVDAVRVMKSTLSSGGSIYEVLAEASLSG
jgi:2'-5' RNA ligase